MIWRTDKPKGSPIVVYRNGNPRPEVLFLATKPYPHYYDDGGEEIPDGMIQKWASLEESSLPSNLDEAAHSYSESDEPLYSPGHRFHWDSDSLFGKQIETTFKAGAKWNREQMMSKAVEGYLERDCGGQLILGRENSPAGDEFMLLDSSLFPEIHAGRKYRVCIIIVKED